MVDYTKRDHIIGNDFANQNTAGFKEEIKSILESYMSRGVNVSRALDEIISNPSERSEFVDAIMESLHSSNALSSDVASHAPFYNNYIDRVEQLLDNSLGSIARESVMTGYAPIVSYAPFFLKNQWVNCVYKDVLMTEIPSSPIINLAYEKRYLKTMSGKKYPIPEVNYDDVAMAEIFAESTGIDIAKDYEFSLPYNQVIFEDTNVASILPGWTGNVTEIAHNVYISSVKMAGSITIGEGSAAKTYSIDSWVPVNMPVDSSTHNFINTRVKAPITDDDDNVVAVAVADILGNVDFETGRVTVMTFTPALPTDFDPYGAQPVAGTISKFKLTGKLANRWNERSIDVVREVERITKTMPESGPRLNSSITVEESADALALQNIDMIADNVDMMGRTLADLEDMEIRTFLKESFEKQEAAGFGPHGYPKLTVAGKFDTLPYETYQGNISTWVNDLREYFERTVNKLKQLLHTEQIAFVAVCNPELIRYFKDNITWSFTNDTNISGMKLNYNFGVMTSADDRIHFITSQYAKPDDGISLVCIPLTNEIITFKHYKYHVIIDRGYRNPVHSLTPNIMATQRTLTFEVLPVQGNVKVTGRELESPVTLERP